MRTFFNPITFLVTSLIIVIGCSKETEIQSAIEGSTPDTIQDSQPTNNGDETSDQSGTVKDAPKVVDLISPENLADSLNGSISSFEPLLDGGIVLAGEFTKYKEIDVPGIAKLDAAGKLDLEFLKNLEKQSFSQVTEIFQNKDGSLTLVGDFSQYKGKDLNYSLSLNLRGEMLEKQILLGSSEDQLLPMENGEIVLARDPNTADPNLPLISLFNSELTEKDQWNSEYLMSSNSSNDSPAEEVAENNDSPAEEVADRHPSSQGHKDIKNSKKWDNDRTDSQKESSHVASHKDRDKNKTHENNGKSDWAKSQQKERTHEASHKDRDKNKTHENNGKSDWAKSQQKEKKNFASSQQDKEKNH